MNGAWLSIETIGASTRLSRFIRCWIWLGLSLVCLCGLQGGAFSADRLEDEARVVRSSVDSVWYDDTHQSVRSPTLSGPSIDISDRNDSIQAPAAANSNNSAWWDYISRAFGDFLKIVFDAWKIIFIIFLLILVGLLLYLVARYGTGVSFRKRNEVGEDIDVTEREKLKIQDLPFEVEQTQLGLLAQAERYRASGDYSKAIIYLFSHALVEMDHARCIHLARGKTNRVYLRELSRWQSLRNFASPLVESFESVFFGKHPIHQDTFERIWNRLPEFQSDLQQAASAITASLAADRGAV